MKKKKDSLAKRHPREYETHTPSPKNAASVEGSAALFISTNGEPSLGAERQSQGRWDKALKSWKPRLEFIAIFFAIGYAVITYFQWRDAQRNSRLDQRAWIGVVNICAVPPGPGLISTDGQCPDRSQGESTGRVMAVWKNFGKTPGLRSHVIAKWRPYEEQIPDFDSPVEGNVPEMDTYPSGLGYAFKDVGPTLQPQGFFFGTVWYDDIFGKHHWVQWCSQIQPNFEGFIACRKHHDSDKNN